MSRPGAALVALLFAAVCAAVPLGAHDNQEDFVFLELSANEVPAPSLTTPRSAEFTPSEEPGDTVSGTLTWKRAANETHIAGYDVMFGFTPEARSRIAYVHNSQGCWILARRDDGNYRVDMNEFPVPYGAKYFLIFGGHPSDDSVPAVVSIYPTVPTESEEQLIQASAPVVANEPEAESASVNKESNEQQVKIELPEPYVQSASGTALEGGSLVQVAAASGSKSHEDPPTPAEDKKGADAADGEAEPEAAPAAPVCDEVLVWQPQNLRIRFDREPKGKKLRGVVSFEGAPFQAKGVASYFVWWGEECAAASKIRDHLPEDPSGNLMAFHRDHNNFPYERFFDWRIPPRLAKVIMVFSADEHGVPLAPPVCVPLEEKLSTTVGLGRTENDNSPPQVVVEPRDNSFPSGTEPVAHAKAKLASTASALQATPSDLEAAPSDGAVAPGEVVGVRQGTTVAAQAGAKSKFFPPPPPPLRRAPKPTPPQPAVPEPTPAPPEPMCDETETTVRALSFFTSGVLDGHVSGKVAFAPAHDRPDATYYSIFFALSCSLTHILPPSSIANLLIDHNQPHMAFAHNLENQRVWQDAAYLLVAATDDKETPLGDPVCVPVSGGSCVDSDDLSNLRPCPNEDSALSVEEPGFSTPGPVDGKLSGVVAFSAPPATKVGKAHISQFFLRFSRSCDAQSVVRNHGVDIEVMKWTQQGNQTMYTGTLREVDVPLGARYLLVFSADASGAALAPPVGVPITGNINNYLQELKDPTFDLHDLVAVTRQARKKAAEKVIASLPSIVQLNTATGNPVFEVMEISPDDVHLPAPGSHAQATLYGAPDLVKRHITRSTPYLPFVRRVALRDDPQERTDFRFFLMASLTPLKVPALSSGEGPVVLTDGPQALVQTQAAADQGVLGTIASVVRGMLGN